VYPSALKAMSTWFRADRGLALGAMVGGLTLGSALPHLVNGLGGLEWRAVILATSLATAAGGLLARLGARDGPFAFPSAPFRASLAARALEGRATRLATLGYFGHMWELYAMWAWYAAFYTGVLERAGAANPARGAAYATFAVIGGGALGCLAGGVLADRWGRTRLTTLAMLLSAACAVLSGLLAAAPPAVVLALGLVWGFWVIADSAQFSAVISEVADQRLVGTALALQLAAGFSLTVVTIWLVPLVRDALGWGAALAMLAVGPLLGAAAMNALRRSPDAARIAGGRG
jgi:MFS family permease